MLLKPLKSMRQEALTDEMKKRQMDRMDLPGEWVTDDGFEVSFGSCLCLVKRHEDSQTYSETGIGSWTDNDRSFCSTLRNSMRVSMFV